MSKNIQKQQNRVNGSTLDTWTWTEVSILLATNNELNEIVFAANNFINSSMNSVIIPLCSHFVLAIDMYAKKYNPRP